VLQHIESFRRVMPLAFEIEETSSKLAAATLRFAISLQDCGNVLNVFATKDAKPYRQIGCGYVATC
jgi:hypothetical protein